jgi:DNA gyrase/topoisomerase IV subunit B
MGDEVPPRKKFIQENAMKVVNLDVWKSFMIFKP